MGLQLLASYFGYQTSNTVIVIADFTLEPELLRRASISYSTHTYSTHCVFVYEGSYFIIRKPTEEDNRAINKAVANICVLNN